MRVLYWSANGVLCCSEVKAILYDKNTCKVEFVTSYNHDLPHAVCYEPARMEKYIDDAFLKDFIDLRSVTRN